MSRLQSNVLKALSDLATAGRGQDEASRLQTLKSALLELGSGTDENSRAIEALDLIGSGDDRGLGIRGCSTTLAGLMNEMEDVPVPAQLVARFPELNQEGWSIALRLTTLLLLAMNANE